MTVTINNRYLKTYIMYDFSNANYDLHFSLKEILPRSLQTLLQNNYDSC